LINVVSLEELERESLLTPQGQVRSDDFFEWLKNSRWGSALGLAESGRPVDIFVWGDLHWRGSDSGMIRVLEMLLPTVAIHLTGGVQDALDDQELIDKQA
jgi:hypothetical protein